MWNLKGYLFFPYSYAICRPRFTLYWKKIWDICFLLLCDIMFDTCTCKTVYNVTKCTVSAEDAQ